mmetsp:Transcript_70516/g.124278  ORF Transcript_70516/g.124278 Transcript_70516/m.124278 type:complete len:136 (-) Transcript_70516:271-678(-)
MWASHCPNLNAGDLGRRFEDDDHDMLVVAAAAAAAVTVKVVAHRSNDMVQAQVLGSQNLIHVETQLTSGSVVMKEMLRDVAEDASLHHSYLHGPPIELGFPRQPIVWVCHDAQNGSYFEHVVDQDCPLCVSRALG